MSDPNHFNIADDLTVSAGRLPDKPALLFGDQSVTYRELDEGVDRITSGLHKLGVRKGDRVAFAIGNRPVFPTVFYGILRLGAVAVPLNTGLKAAELRPYLNDVGPRAIICDESVVNEVMSAGPHSAPVFVIGKHSSARPFEQVISDAEPPVVDVSSDDLAVLAYTSGTSGSSKAAMLTHRNLAANVDQMLQIPTATTAEDDVVLGVLPMFHIFALNVILGLSIRQGATVVIEERFDPAGTIQTVVSHGVTIIVGAPPMFISWLTSRDVPHRRLENVRFAISGASKLPIETVPAFRESFGVEIWEGYGLTETSPTLTTTRMGKQRLGSVGKPLQDVELRIVDATGADVAIGDPGEIWAKGPNVFKGYWQDEAATADAFAEEWFRTGDLAYRDEDGYIWLVDRKKELIIVSGFNVYPREVEDALRSHPSVEQAAVVGVPHPRQGESVKAYVKTRADMRASEEELIVHCARLLARFKVPSEVEFVRDLPQLPSGKVLKRLLRPKELGPPV